MFTLGGKLWAANDGAFGCVPRTQAYCLRSTSLPPNSKPKDNTSPTNKLQQEGQQAIEAHLLK
jgi:hypothetical protein